MRDEVGWREKSHLIYLLPSPSLIPSIGDTLSPPLCITVSLLPHFTVCLFSPSSSSTEYEGKGYERQNEEARKKQIVGEKNTILLDRVRDSLKYFSLLGLSCPSFHFSSDGNKKSGHLDVHSYTQTEWNEDSLE